jgi:hypothetical protein
VNIRLINKKLAAQSIEFEVGGGEMPRILNTRISPRVVCGRSLECGATSVLE